MAQYNVVKRNFKKQLKVGTKVTSYSCRKQIKIRVATLITLQCFYDEGKISEWKLNISLVKLQAC